MDQNSEELGEIVQATSDVIRRMMNFWKTAHGWAPIEAAALLNKSMLEWQSALADCLHLWTHQLSDGELILAWANIGTLVEGQLRLFLSVYYEDYVADADAKKDKKTGKLIDPDSITFEGLRVLFQKSIWEASEPWNDWVHFIQKRRNTIHAYRSNEVGIGTTEELHEALRWLLEFVSMMDSRLPYP